MPLRIYEEHYSINTEPKCMKYHIQENEAFCTFREELQNFVHLILTLNIIYLAQFRRS